jgi:hypothetical protein
MKMTAKNIIKEEVILQLNRQGIIFEILNDEELNKIYEKWIEKFIGNKKAPILENYKWHIFSYNKKKLEGIKATEEYNNQYPSDVYIFNEKLDFGIKCKVSENLPMIKFDEHFDDIYISHYNMKWTYVITHESPFIGPYFSK